MAAARLLVGVAILTTLSCVAAASQNPVTDIDKGEFVDTCLGVLYDLIHNPFPRNVVFT